VLAGASVAFHTVVDVEIKGQALRSASAFSARIAIRLMLLPVSLSSASHAGTGAAFFFTRSGFPRRLARCMQCRLVNGYGTPDWRPQRRRL
jgi:hypothetical protein